jgi:nicotinamidase-related amidase
MPLPAYPLTSLPATAALLLIDLQLAVDNPSWGQRNNPGAEQNAGRLLAAWRETGRPIYHLRHDSTEPNSTYRPGQIGNQFKPEVLPQLSHQGETLTVKNTNSAFIGTDLESRLRAAGHTTLIVVGVSSSNSVETTVRMAGNLGFDTYMVADATFTFAKKDWNGRLRSAEEVHDMALANLHDEYCAVITTSEIFDALKN